LEYNKFGRAGVRDMALSHCALDWPLMTGIGGIEAANVEGFD
jgi:hypothetical protein